MHIIINIQFVFELHEHLKLRREFLFVNKHRSKNAEYFGMESLFLFPTNTMRMRWEGVRFDLLWEWNHVEAYKLPKYESARKGCSKIAADNHTYTKKSESRFPFDTKQWINHYSFIYFKWSAWLPSLGSMCIYLMASSHLGSGRSGWTGLESYERRSVNRACSRNSRLYVARTILIADADSTSTVKLWAI